MALQWKVINDNQWSVYSDVNRTEDCAGLDAVGPEH